MRTISRRELLTVAATGAVAIATPAKAEALEQFSPDEVINDGQRFFGTVSVDWPMGFRKQAGVGACPTRISLVKRPLARSSGA